MFGPGQRTLPGPWWVARLGFSLKKPDQGRASGGHVSVLWNHEYHELEKLRPSACLLRSSHLVAPRAIGFIQICSPIRAQGASSSFQGPLRALARRAMASGLINSLLHLHSWGSLGPQQR